MAPIKTLKNSTKRKQFFHGLILTVLTCSFMCSYSSFCFPSVNSFILITVRDLMNSVAESRILFIIVNLIIVVLVGESKFGGSKMKLKRSTETGDVYDEYVSRSRSLECGGSLNAVVEEKEPDEGLIEAVAEDVTERKVGDEEEVECEREDGEGDEVDKEELNRRIEEFIARVNEQRWIEDRTFMCL